MGYIYIIRNNINDKVYVGKTEYSISKRFAEHISDSSKRVLERRPLYAAMRKYGTEHFYVEELERTEDLSNREMYWISYYNSYKKGYNATRGGDGKSYIDHKEIITLFQKVGTVSKVASLLHHDASYVAQIIKNAGLHINSSEWSQFTVGKIVGQFDRITRQLIRIFPTAKSAGRYLGDVAKSSHIKSCASGKQKSAYNYYWKFMETTELYNAPGLVITPYEISRTTKVKKFIDKKKLKTFKIVYLENPPADYKELERALKEFEDKYTGKNVMQKEREVFNNRSPKYEYRINCNTVLKAYTEEQFLLLKKWYNVI